MDYNSRDFDGLMLNVMKHPVDEDLLQVFPILGAYNVFKEQVFGISKTKLIRYIVLAFDRGTPLVSINDIMERRVKAMLLAGVPVNRHGKFPEEIDMILKSQKPEVNNMVIQYCILSGGSKYSVFVTYQEVLRKQLEKLLGADENQDTKVLIQNINNIKGQIDHLTKEIFLDNVDSFLTRSLGEFAEADMLEYSPEKYAEKLSTWNHITKYYEHTNNTAIKHEVSRTDYELIIGNKLQFVNHIVEDENFPRKNRWIKFFETDNEGDRTNVYTYGIITDVELVDGKEYVLYFDI